MPIRSRAQRSNLREAITHSRVLQPIMGDTSAVRAHILRYFEHRSHYTTIPAAVLGYGRSERQHLPSPALLPRCAVQLDRTGRGQMPSDPSISNVSRKALCRSGLLFCLGDVLSWAQFRAGLGEDSTPLHCLLAGLLQRPLVLLLLPTWSGSWSHSNWHPGTQVCPQPMYLRP